VFPARTPANAVVTRGKVRLTFHAGESTLWPYQAVRD
jgi:hypothetical protein